MATRNWERKLRDEERKLTKILEELAAKSDVKLDSAGNPVLGFNRVNRTSVEVQVNMDGEDGDEYQSILRHELAMMRSRSRTSSRAAPEDMNGPRWDEIMVEQIQQDYEQQLREKDAEIAALRAQLEETQQSAVQLLQWKNSTANHIILLLHSFKQQMNAHKPERQTTVSASQSKAQAGAQQSALSRLQPLHDRLVQILTERLSLPAALEELQTDAMQIVAKESVKQREQKVDRFRHFHRDVEMFSLHSHAPSTATHSLSHPAHDLRVLPHREEEVLALVFDLLLRLQTTVHDFREEQTVSVSDQNTSISRRLFLSLLLGLDAVDEHLTLQAAAEAYSTVSARQVHDREAFQKKAIQQSPATQATISPASPPTAAPVPPASPAQPRPPPPSQTPPRGSAPPPPPPLASPALPRGAPPPPPRGAPPPPPPATTPSSSAVVASPPPRPPPLGQATGSATSTGVVVDCAPPSPVPDQQQPSTKRVTPSTGRLLYVDFVAALELCAQSRVKSRLRDLHSSRSASLTVSEGTAFSTALGSFVHSWAQRLSVMVAEPAIFRRSLRLAFPLTAPALYALLSAHQETLLRHARRLIHFSLKPTGSPSRHQTVTGERFAGHGSGYESFCTTVGIVPRLLPAAACRRVSEHVRRLYPGRVSLSALLGTLGLTAEYVLGLQLTEETEKKRSTTIPLSAEDLVEAQMLFVMQDMVLTVVRHAEHS